MNNIYDNTINYLYNQYPVFQNIGGDAYKPGLERSEKLDSLFNHPHQHYKTIHIGGTNGKGSTSHALAAVLQKSGYTVGLYTSPHLVDFRERIRINGEMIDKNYVINFVEKNKSDFEPFGCSFFELTMMMAFCYFRDQNVDVAIIEVGLGGLLDSTNIISPTLSIITNISLDHTQFLGNTVDEIATQKAGIIKPNIPIVIGSTTGNTKNIFTEYAKLNHSPIFFAEDMDNLIIREQDSHYLVESKKWGNLIYELGGFAQKENIKTILCSLDILQDQGFNITSKSVEEGLSDITGITHLRGRWEILNDKYPFIVCDTGHNIGGVEYVVKQLNSLKTNDLRIMIGFANDKDIDKILKILPKNATYYFVAANTPRAMDAAQLKIKANIFGLLGESYKSIEEAFNIANQNHNEDTCIFIGGSNFVVGELLSFI